MNDQTSSPPAADPIEILDVPNRIRIMDCAECGNVFALPMRVYLLRAAEHGSIYCACCGALTTLADTELQKAEIALISVQMIAELRQEQIETATLRTRLARMPRLAEGPISAEELERRIKYIVNRATPREFGKRICPLCEALATPRSLRNHLRREHTAEVSALPAEAFDRP